MATPQQLVQADEWSQYLMWGGQCFRPCPSVTSPGPFRAFNKVREVVSCEETIWNVDMWAGVSLATDKTSEAKYLVVHTKDTKYGPKGKRELWASHGRITAEVMPYTPAVKENKPKKVWRPKGTPKSGASWSRTTAIVAKWGRKPKTEPKAVESVRGDISKGRSFKKMQNDEMEQAYAEAVEEAGM